MDNLANLGKVLEGLKGAKDILKSNITSEALELMTPEERDSYNKAISNIDVIKSVADLEKFTKTL